MEQEQQNRGVIAGEPTDDIITGAVVKSARSGPPTRTTTRNGGSLLSKNKTRNKGVSSQMTAPGDVVVSAQDKLKSVSSPASKEDLITSIKSMPDKMLPNFVKPYTELMVKNFGIDTREKVANFLGQVSGESIRGVAEYVYYRNIKDLKGAFGNRVTSKDMQDFVYSSPSPSKPYGFTQGKAPWQINGMLDSYYGSRNGNTNGNSFNRISTANNTRQGVSPTEPPSNFLADPYNYKGSSDGYAYRGHGVIQITGKVQYEQMNKFFGVNGSLEKNNVDFVKNPELISENPKFAFLSALMWWANHKGVYINNVSLPTTKTITTAVRGNSGGYQSRHKNVERYFYFLVYGDTGDLSDTPTPKGFIPGKLKTKADVTPYLTEGERSSLFGEITYVAAGGDSIRITNNYSSKIKFVNIPQMKKLGLDGMQFHYLGETQLKGLWAEWEQLGLLEQIITFNGSFVPRFVRQTRGPRRPISSHSWGVAFDINASWNGIGMVPSRVGTFGSVRLLVKSAIKWGFYWGGWWPGRPDGMHFEINRLDYK